MSLPSPPPSPPASGLPLAEHLSEDGIKACCAALYQHPVVRWLLGDELHPGGEASTRRALELIDLSPGERLLDVACGPGTSAVLAAHEFGCEAAGVEYSEGTVSAARAAAEAERLADRVRFVRGDAEALPFANGEFDAVLCECSLSAFPDKPRAVAEMRRVLRPGGRAAITDVIVDRDRLPEELTGHLAAIACIGEALPQARYEELIGAAGLRVVAFERRDRDAAILARRVEERLRGVRMLGLEGLEEGLRAAIESALEVAGAARRAISDGALGYAIIAAAG